MPDANGAVDRSERLPSVVKLCFGAPAFAGAAMAIPIGVLMPRFYSDVVLAPLGAIAIAIALARAFDALTDPLMGWLSDRTRTRFGRRKPFIAVGVPFAALAFYGLFSPPGSLSPLEASVWFGAAFGLYFLFHTIAEIPYAALGAEVTPDYHERSSLFGIRSFFIAAGTIVASLMPAFLARLPGIGDERRVYSLMAGLYAILLILLYAGLLWRVDEHPEYARREQGPLVPGVRRALRNRPFRILLLAGIVSAIPAAIPAILMPYYVGYVLQPAHPGSVVSLFLTVYLGAGLLFVPLWMAIARRVGKLRTLIVASGIGISGSIFYFFAGAGDLLFAGAIYFVTGTVSMAGNFLVPAMAADVIDYDELRTGKRREAQYASFWALIPKLVAIPGSSVPLAILAAVGYVPNQIQTDEVQFTIRFLYSLFPASFYVAALLIVSRYPISESVHREVRRAIAILASGGPATDPLTGATLRRARHGGLSEQQGWFLDNFSAGELRRALRRGRHRLLVDVALSAGLALLVLAAAVVVASWGFRGAESSPPLSTVFAVVTAGLALAAFFFHALRLGPARRMRREPWYDALIVEHLDESGGATGSVERRPGP